MSWLPEILAPFSARSLIPHAGQSCAASLKRSGFTTPWYYQLPTTLFVVSAFVSWKTTVIAAGLFIVSLMAGAVTETDGLGAR